MRLLATLAMVLVPVSTIALAGEIIPGPVTADVVSVYDGDTPTVDAHPWLHLEDGLPRYEKWPEKVLESPGLDSTTRHAEFEER